jgi:hypothetical protein
MSHSPPVTVSQDIEDRYRVEVGTDQERTVHTVKVPPGLVARLGWPAGSADALVRASFAFLLEREPPSSILAVFSLEVIGDYFPDYPAEMRALAAGQVPAES